MSRNYWPVFIIVTACSTAAVWTQAPKYADHFPVTFRDWCKNTVNRITNKETESDASTQNEHKMAWRPFGNNVRSVEGENSDIVAKPIMPVKRDTATDKIRVSLGSDELSRAVATNGSIDPSHLPSMLGITPADAKRATWGVTGQSCGIESLGGRHLGNVKGGRFFLIERRCRSEEGLMLIGNFWPKSLSEPVQILAQDICCFSGTPTSLSEEQLDSLREYYELRDEALQLKAKLSKRWYDDNDVAHPGEDPIKNREYLSLLERMKTASAKIPGLAF